MTGSIYRTRSNSDAHINVNCSCPSAGWDLASDFVMPKFVKKFITPNSLMTCTFGPKEEERSHA